MCNVYDGREKQDDKASCVYGSPTTLQSFIVGTSNLFSLFLSHFCLHYTFQRNTTSSIFFVHTYFFLCLFWVLKLGFIIIFSLYPLYFSLYTPVLLLLILLYIAPFLINNFCSFFCIYIFMK